MGWGELKTVGACLHNGASKLTKQENPRVDNELCRVHVVVTHTHAGIVTHMASVTRYTKQIEIDCPAMTYEACRACVRFPVSGAVLCLRLGGPRLVYSSRQRLLLAQVVKVLSVQHLGPLPLSVDLVAGAILAVYLAEPVMLLVATERAIQRVSVQRR